MKIPGPGWRLPDFLRPARFLRKAIFSPAEASSASPAAQHATLRAASRMLAHDPASPRMVARVIARIRAPRTRTPRDHPRLAAAAPRACLASPRIAPASMLLLPGLSPCIRTLPPASRPHLRLRMLHLAHGCCALHGPGGCMVSSAGNAWIDFGSDLHGLMNDA